LPRLIEQQEEIQNLAIPGLVDQVICVSTHTTMSRISLRR